MCQVYTLDRLWMAEVERLRQNISGATVLLCCSYSGPVKMHLEGLMEDNLPIIV